MGKVTVTVRKVETVTGDFLNEPGEPFWRIEIDGYCADFDSEAAAMNFAAAINGVTGPQDHDATFTITLTPDKTSCHTSAGDLTEPLECIDRAISVLLHERTKIERCPRHKALGARTNNHAELVEALREACDYLESIMQGYDYIGTGSGKTAEIDEKEDQEALARFRKALSLYGGEK